MGTSTLYRNQGREEDGVPFCFSGFCFCFLAGGFDEPAVGMMRTTKQALDPLNILIRGTWSICLRIQSIWGHESRQAMLFFRLTSLDREAD